MVAPLVRSVGRALGRPVGRRALAGVLRLIQVARPVRSVFLSAVLLLGASGGGAGAQMRPLDPVEWAPFHQDGGLVTVGGSVLFGQRAALLGSEGRLVEYGELVIAMRVDRVVIHVGGAPIRTFDQQTRYREPAEGVRPGDDSRSDAGTVWASTTVALGVDEGSDPSAARWAARFGVRLPTTDDVQGLERDETDFFVSLARRQDLGEWELSTELGASIFGVHGDRHAQTDPYQYQLALRRAVGAESAVRPYAELTGHVDTRTHGAPLGNDHLSELRLGAEIGARRFLNVAAIVGLATHSPDFGIRVRVGTVY